MLFHKREEVSSKPCRDLCLLSLRDKLCLPASVQVGMQDVLRVFGKEQLY